MADMPNDFWSGWIIVVTLVSFVGLVWLVVSVYTAAPPNASEVEHTIWDENLQEGINPAPLWWFWMIFVMMVFSVFYLMLYLGMGSFKGAFHWSQAGRLEDRVDDFKDQFNDLRAEIAQMPLEEIQASDSLMASGDDLFEQNCAACHGYEGQGQANLFPDLMDEIWQWGGTPENIEQSIRFGRTAVMAGWATVLGQVGVTNVANYVQVIGTTEAQGHPGQTQFNQVCAACHTPAGTGNILLGAPNLTDDDWLYGSDIDTIRTTIIGGRNGQMPAFNDILDDTQVRLLVAWLTRQ